MPCRVPSEIAWCRPGKAGRFESSVFRQDGHYGDYYCRHLARRLRRVPADMVTKMTKFTFTATVSLDAVWVGNAFDCQGSFGSQIQHPKHDSWDEAFADPDMKLEFLVDTGDEIERTWITHDMLLNGLKLLHEQYPEYVAEFSGGGGDGMMADCLCQLCAYGEWRYS